MEKHEKEGELLKKTERAGKEILKRHLRGERRGWSEPERRMSGEV